MNQSNPKQERTPGPWRFDVADRPYIKAGGVTIAKTYRSAILQHGVSDIPGEANASHIVHCVNTYDEVVAALESVLDQWTPKPGEYEGIEFYVDAKRSHDQARAALAKARGGEA